MRKTARGAKEGAPLLYTTLESAPIRHTSPSKILEHFLAPAPTPEPLERHLHQPDGSVRCLTLPPRLRRLPTEILYDAKGLELYDKVTQLDDSYYLTGCEREILTQQTPSIASFIPDGASLIELGCGSMSKTTVILNHLRRAGKKGITYYGLDIDEEYLKSSLKALMKDEAKIDVPEENAIKYAGLLGSYDQGVAVLKDIKGPHVLLWLGSSIGNTNRTEATQLLSSIAGGMDIGDVIFIGMDNRNDSRTVAKAYNDQEGVVAQFVMNGLSHLNVILGEDTFIRENFTYFAGYNSVEGRHEAYYQSLANQTIEIPWKGNERKKVVQLEKDELIHIVYSTKYSLEEVQQVGEDSGLELTQFWSDSRKMYRFCLFTKKVELIGCSLLLSTKSCESE